MKQKNRGCITIVIRHNSEAGNALDKQTRAAFEQAALAARAFLADSIEATRTIGTFQKDA